MRRLSCKFGCSMRGEKSCVRARVGVFLICASRRLPSTCRRLAYTLRRYPKLVYRTQAPKKNTAHVYTYTQLCTYPNPSVFSCSPLLVVYLFQCICPLLRHQALCGLSACCVADPQLIASRCVAEAVVAGLKLSFRLRGSKFSATF